MTAATVERMEHKKARAEEANLLLEGLDEVTQKIALYIATKGISKKRHRRRDEEKLILKRIASKSGGETKEYYWKEKEKE